MSSAGLTTSSSTAGADDGGIGIEGLDDAEALRGEAGVAEDGAAELADADDDHRPAAVEAEDLVQLLQEAADVVAAALFSEAAKVAEVLANLCGGDAELRAQLLRADDLPAGALERLRGRARRRGGGR